MLQPSPAQPTFAPGFHVCCCLLWSSTAQPARSPTSHVYWQVLQASRGVPKRSSPSPSFHTCWQVLQPSPAQHGPAQPSTAQHGLPTAPTLTGRCCSLVRETPKSPYQTFPQTWPSCWQVLRPRLAQFSLAPAMVSVGWCSGLTQGSPLDSPF